MLVPLPSALKQSGLGFGNLRAAEQHQAAGLTRFLRRETSQPIKSPTAKQTAPTTPKDLLAKSSITLSNRFVETCRLATSHLSFSLINVAVHRPLTFKVLPFASLNSSSELPKQIPVFSP